jgi:hypothetical protein
LKSPPPKPVPSVRFGVFGAYAPVFMSRADPWLNGFLLQGQVRLGRFFGVEAGVQFLQPAEGELGMGEVALRRLPIRVGGSVGWQLRKWHLSVAVAYVIDVTTLQLSSAGNPALDGSRRLYHGVQPGFRAGFSPTPRLMLLTGVAVDIHAQSDEYRSATGKVIVDYAPVQPGVFLGAGVWLP